MSIFVFVVVVVVVISLDSLLLCQATHFRGARFSFRSLTANQAEIGFRLTWRLSYSQSTRCNRSIVESGALIGPETPGYVVCDVGCKGRVGDVSIHCTDYSVLENWMTGVRAYNHSFQGNGIYELIWEGEGWFKGDVPWLFRIRMNLNRRNSTGKVNSSPRAIMSPYPINLQHGCSANIYISVTDDDGDVVRCRWAESKYQECGGVCRDSFDVGRLIVTLDEEKCSLQLSESIVPDDYIIALQLEDFDPQDIRRQFPLSSVPLQFSISIYNSSANSSSSSSLSNTSTGANSSAAPSWCQVGPVFVSPSPVNGSCWSMRKHNFNNSVTIAATTKDSVTRVSRFNAIGPMNVNFYISDVILNGSVYYVIMTLTSDYFILEGKTFCFQAIDNFGFSSELLCFKISFDLDPPKAISAAFDSMRKRIIITFNQQIIRPAERHLVTVIDVDSGMMLATYDTSAADQVTFEPNAITMTATNQTLTVMKCLYLFLEAGAVLNQCGTSSLQVINTTTLNFTTSLSGPEGCSLFSSTATTTKAADTSSKSQLTTSSSSTSSSSQGTATTVKSSTWNASSVEASGEVGSLDYRWLIVAVVCSVVVFSVVVLFAAFVIKRRHSRSNDRRRRQERFFNTLNSRGISNWSYDQRTSSSPSKSNTQTPTTTTTVAPQTAADPY